jgi:hypothetical protein
MPNLEILSYYKSRRLPSNSCSPFYLFPRAGFFFGTLWRVGSMEYKRGKWHDQFADLEAVVMKE